MISIKNIYDQMMFIAGLFEIGRGDTELAGKIREAAAFIKEFDDEHIEAEALQSGIAVEFIAGLVADIASGKMPEAQAELLDRIPHGIPDLVNINGLTPMKVRTLWKEYGIVTIGHLAVACDENRLEAIPGFGAKTQEKIRRDVENRILKQDVIPYGLVQPLAEQLISDIRHELGGNVLMEFTGEYRRKLPMISKVQVLAAPGLYKDVMLALVRADNYELLTAGSDMIQARIRDTQLTFEFIFTSVNFYLSLFETTGPEKFVNHFDTDPMLIYGSEEEIFKDENMLFIPPEYRLEDYNASKRIVLSGSFPIKTKQLKGLLLSPANTGKKGAADLVNAAIGREMEYFGFIDDNEVPDLKKLTKAHSFNDQITLLRGVKTTVNENGKLDVSEVKMSQADFVVVTNEKYSRFDEKANTARLLNAIRNPFTNFLANPSGHLNTGLDKAPPLDAEAIVYACSENNVILQFNCNMFRMDPDLEWLKLAAKYNAKILIDPALLENKQFEYLDHGIILANKAGLKKEQIFNLYGLAEVKEHFLGKRKIRIR